MKKIVLSMIMAGTLLISGTALAQNKADGNTGATAQKECCNDKKSEKKDKKEGKKDGKKGIKGEKAAKMKFNPFDGVQLTPDQQQRLQVLQQGLGPVQLTPEQQAKIKENPNLSPEQKAQLKKERKAKKMEAKKNYLKGVKEILTPDQYVIFLENVYLYSPQAEKTIKSNKAQKQAIREFKGKKGDKKEKIKTSANQ